MPVGNHPWYFHGLNYPIMKPDGDHMAEAISFLVCVGVTR